MKLCVRCDQVSATTSPSCDYCGDSPREVDGFPSFIPEASDHDGFEPEYFPQLAEVEDQYFWFRVRARIVLDAIQRFFPAARSVLEVGCGTGSVLAAIRRRLPEVALSGSDVFVEGLKVAAPRVPDARLLQFDARRVPFVEEFDVICALDVLEHVVEDDLVLSQAWQAIRPGGGIVLTVPQHRVLWSAADVYSRHKRQYSRPQLVAKVRQAGFEVRFVSSFMSLLLPALWLRRLTAARSPRPFDPMAEFRIPGWVNTGLEGIMELERRLIRRGASFPAGASLLVVGSK